MKRYTDDEKDEIRELLLWKPVKKIGDDLLEVGFRFHEKKLLRLGGNEGCGGCSAGNYDLTELNGTNHSAITAVEFEDAPENEWGEREGSYKIFVLCENEKIKLAEFEGGDGNGYYGTGYWIEVYE